MIALIDGDPLVYQAAWGRSPGDAKAHVGRLIGWMMEATFATDKLIAVGSKFNYRNDFFPFYKKSPSRANSKESLPEWFPEITEHLRTLPDTYHCIGHEADDQLRIWSYEAREYDIDYVICSIDKDLDAIPGAHYNNKKGEIYHVTPEYAQRFMWYQLLVGDSVDNIPGLPGIGPKRAESMLFGLTTPKQYANAVVKAYKDKFAKDWWEYLMSNFRLLYIQRKHNDFPVIKKSDFPD